MLIDGFENIKLLCQYMYMSEDHKIKLHNAIGVPLELYMDDELRIYCRNLNFPNLPSADYSADMHPAGLLDVVEALKSEPPVNYKDKFNSRWEEIKAITKMNVVENEMQRKH